MLVGGVSGPAAAAAGGADWALKETWTHSVDVTTIDFLNLAGAKAIRIVGEGLKNGVNLPLAFRVSTDNGVTWLASLIYKVVLSDGTTQRDAGQVPINQDKGWIFQTPMAYPRYWTTDILFNDLLMPKPIVSTVPQTTDGTTSPTGMIMMNDPINAIRLWSSGTDPTWVYTGGTIRVFTK